MLSVVWNGYAIPLVWTTKKGKKGHFPEDVHIELIKIAQPILPIDCRVVLLGDGEFDGMRLRNQCKSWGWEFVLRTALDRLVDCGGEQAKLGLYTLWKGKKLYFAGCLPRR